MPEFSGTVLAIQEIVAFFRNKIKMISYGTLSNTLRKL